MLTPGVPRKTRMASLPCGLAAQQADTVAHPRRHASPAKTGKQVISCVRELRGANFRALVITGDTGSAVHRFDSDSTLCWIRKPVDSEQLLTLLKRLLP